jgi:hypothetical protein
VAEYRKPEFTIDSAARAKPEVLHGDVITATVSGQYFFGGPVSNAPGAVGTVYSEDAYFNYTGDTAGRWYSFNDYTGWDPTTLRALRRHGGQRRGKTGADGSIHLPDPGRHRRQDRQPALQHRRARHST